MDTYATALQAVYASRLHYFRQRRIVDQAKKLADAELNAGSITRSQWPAAAAAAMLTALKLAA